MSECKKKVVIALGGNALQDFKGSATPKTQLKVVRRTCNYIIELIKKGYQIVIVHGNGPQVGEILLAYETASGVTPVMPFDVCGAMSQGFIGYHIQQALGTALRENALDIPVVTLLTQLVVNQKDPAFRNPTKPIGSFYTREEAKRLEIENGYIMREDAGRGWRRVVPSPIPEKIVEIDTVKRLWDSTIVITAGGGGIPVIEKSDGSLEGVAAVIDKDFAAELLAEQLDADILMILTEVEKVSLNFNKLGQVQLSQITADEAERYIEEGHFSTGSMLPKVQAAVKYAKSAPGKKAIITSLYKAIEGIEEKTGTIITQ